MHSYTVIVPTFNRHAVLGMCIGHLESLKFPRDRFEVVVVDNGSTDETPQLLEQYAGALNLRSVRFDRDGLMGARHAGLAAARGDVVCFIDDDSLVTPGWLAGVDDAMQRAGVVLVGGPCEPSYEASPPGWLKHFWAAAPGGQVLQTLSLIDLGPRSREIDPMYVFGCNYSVRRRVLIEVGGMNPDYFPPDRVRLCGSGESGIRWRLRPHGVAWYSPQARIQHMVSRSRMTPEYFERRAFINGVEASYSALRRAAAVDPALGSERRVASAYDRTSVALRRRWRRIWQPRSVTEMRGRLDERFREGFEYHQREFAEDPALREWVLRRAYYSPLAEPQGSVP